MATLIYIALAVAAFLILRWRFRRVRREFGSAHWLKVWTAARRGLLGFRGIPLGDWDWTFLPIRFNDDGHILTVAPPGGGKSVTGSIPSGLDRHIASRFIADPDGEVTAVCIGAWRRDGRSVYVINPAKIFTGPPWSLPSHRFDPMTFVRPEADDFGKRAEYIATALVTRSGADDGATQYFKAEAIHKLTAFIAFGALKGVKLPQIRDWTGLPDTGSEPPAGAPDGIYRSQSELWDAMAEETALEGRIARQAVDLRDKRENAPPEFQAVLSTIRGAVAFLDDPSIREAMSGSDVDWSALKSGNAVIAVVMPRQDWKIHAPFVRLAFLSAIWTLEEGPVARQRIHMLLEEFPTLGRMDFFSDVLATARKKKAQIEVVIQNMGQLSALYPDWKALLPNFEVRRFKAVRDIETARYVSEALGIATEWIRHRSLPRGLEQPHSRALMTPDEVMAMQKDRQIVFIGNNRPAWLGQYPYWEKAHLRRRALPNPYYPGALPALPEGALGRWLGGHGLRLVAYLTGPHPQVGIATLAFLIWWVNPQILIAEERDTATRQLSCTFVGWKGSWSIQGRYETPATRCWYGKLWGEYFGW